MAACYWRDKNIKQIIYDYIFQVTTFDPEIRRILEIHMLCVQLSLYALQHIKECHIFWNHKFQRLFTIKNQWSFRYLVDRWIFGLWERNCAKGDNLGAFLQFFPASHFSLMWQRKINSFIKNRRQFYILEQVSIFLVCIISPPQCSKHQKPPKNKNSEWRKTLLWTRNVPAL